MKHWLTGAIVGTAATCILVSAAAAQSITPGASARSEPPRGAILVVELSNSIDAGKAKVGDKVKGNVAQDVLAHGELIVRRGSKIEGHVAQAKRYSKEDPESVLQIVFDSVFLKGGGELSVNAIVLALAPSVEQPDELSSSAYGGADPGGTQRVSRGGERPLVDPRERIDHTRDDALRNASDPNAYGTSNPGQGGMLSSGNRGVYGMPGLSLKVLPGSSVTIVVSNKSTIKLNSGTQMVLEDMAGPGR